jgi:DNA-binding NtrC family response regulator
MAVILVVEDEVFIRQAAEWAIEDMGHVPMMAEDLASALAHLSADQTIDALFVDIRLNTLAHGGYDVANQVDGLRPGLRVLYTSGTPLTADMSARFVADGRFIQKPYSPDQLEAAITSLLNENRVTPQPRGVTASTF